MGFKTGSSIVQGFLGNLSEVSAATLAREYGSYLMTGETITTGFILIRDVLILTDKRILTFDKQGATGQKMRVDSINLSSIFHVTAETAGFGIDDCELTIFYIVSPYLKAHDVEYEKKNLEFPKKYNISELYKTLQEIAYENYCKLNH